MYANERQIAEHHRTLVDAYLRELVSKKRQQAKKISPAYAELWQSIEALVNKGGKRLRPLLVEVAAASFGAQKHENSVVAGAALELLHICLLIHDDVIDRDDERYGIKNVSGQYKEKYARTALNDANRTHYANSAALLAGDLLLSESHALLYELRDIDSMQQAKIATLLHEAVFMVCGGELLDTESAFRVSSPALSIAEYKTASYSFIAPLLIGAVLGGADESAQAILRDFARVLGIAYQLQDDILGVFGDEEVTGKTNIGDIREGKRTFMVEVFYERATSEQKCQFDDVFGVARKPRSVYEKCAKLLEASGARSVVEEKIALLETEALGYIKQLPISEVSKQRYEWLLDICLKRNV